MSIESEIDNIIDSTEDLPEQSELIFDFIVQNLSGIDDDEKNDFIIHLIKHLSSISNELSQAFVLNIYILLCVNDTLFDLNNYSKFFLFILGYLSGKWEQGEIINETEVELYLVSFLVCKRWDLIEPHKYKQFLNAIIKSTPIGPYFDLDKQIERLETNDSIQTVKEFVQLFMQLNRYFLDLISISNNAISFEDEIIGGTQTPINQENTFYILKKYNSIYPALQNPSDLGGGFYIRWEQKGIVIDPGFNFYSQLQSIGYSIQDIDCIFITHVHDDHCRDLSLMMSVMYKANKKRDDNNKISIPIFGSENIYRKYSYLDGDFDKTVFSLSRNNGPLLANKKLRELSLPIQISKLPAYHNEEPFTNIPGGDSMGVSLRLYGQNGTRTIIFSGDTRYSNDLANFYFKSNPDLIVLNLGKVEEDFSQHYDNHLGIKGCKDLIIDLKRKGLDKGLILISEFGLEMSPNRVDICKILKNWISLEQFDFHNSNIAILPTDNHTIINLNNLLIKTDTQQFHDPTLVEPILEDDQIFFRPIVNN